MDNETPRAKYARYWELESEISQTEEYLEYLQEERDRIMQELGMTNSSPDLPPDQAPAVSEGQVVMTAGSIGS